MQIVSASNPVYGDKDHKTILLDVKCDELGDQKIKFLAKPDDVEEHGVNLFCRAMVGEFGPVAPFEAKSVDQLHQIKSDLLNRLDLELFKRLPVFKAYRQGINAINAATTKDEAIAALASVRWPDGEGSDGITC